MPNQIWFDIEYVPRILLWSLKFIVFAHLIVLRVDCRGGAGLVVYSLESATIYILAVCIRLLLTTNFLNS